MPTLAMTGGIRRGRELLLFATSFAIVLALVFPRARLNETTGLECEDYANPAWQGHPFETRIEHDLTTPLLATRPARFVQSFSTECHGTLRISRSGTFRVVVWTRAAVQVFADDRLVLQSRPSARQPTSGIVDLEAGDHSLRFRYALAAGTDEPQFLMARVGAPLRPLDSFDVSRHPLSAAAYGLRVAAVASPLLLLLWFGIVAYRLRPAIARGWQWVSPPLVRLHRAIVPSTRRSLAAITIVAVAVRIALTFATYPILWPDSVQYYDTALAFLKADFFSHNLISTPLFPAFMSAFLAVDLTPAAGAGMIAAQRALGVGAAVVVYFIAREAFGKTVAFYTALVWSVSALQLYYESVVATEALFVTVLILTVFAAARMLRSDSLVLSAVVGLMCAVGTLTRPVAKGLVFIVLAVVCSRGGERRRLALMSAVLLGTFAVVIAPWMYVNHRTYGFWGINRGEGLWLFLRTLDIDELDPPARTRFPEVKEIVDALRPTQPYLHYAVRDELNFNRGYSSAQADEIMFAFAAETAMAHPMRFALGTVIQEARLFMNPYRSVQICESAYGPHLCADRGADLSFPPFPNRPTAGRKPLKMAIAAFVRATYWVLPLLAPMAAIGMVRALGARDHRFSVRVLLAATVLYMTLATALFNTVQDRYRLPVDAFLVMFAIYALRRRVPSPQGPVTTAT